MNVRILKSSWETVGPCEQYELRVLIGPAKTGAIVRYAERSPTYPIWPSDRKLIEQRAAHYVGASLIEYLIKEQTPLDDTTS